MNNYNQNLTYTDYADADLSNLTSTGVSYLDTNYLPLSGNSISKNPITGSIYVKQSGTDWKSLWVNCSDMDLTNPDSSTAVNGGRFITVDTNNTWVGTCQHGINSSGASFCSIGARTFIDGDSSDAASGFISIYALSDGTIYTHAPTPSNNDDSTKIATTAFVSNMLTSSNSNFITFSKGTSGYFKFANGLLIQWLKCSFSSSTTTVFSLPTSYSSSTSYMVAAVDSGTSRISYGFDRTSASSITGYSSATGSWAHVIAVGY